MRKIKYLVLIVLAGTTMFISSCSKDKNTTPTITFIGGTGYTSANATVAPSTTIKVGINAAKGPDGANLKQYKIERVFNNNVTLVFDTNTISSENYTKTAMITTKSVAGTEKFKFTIYDKDGNTAEIEFDITTTSPVTYGAIHSWTGKVLGDQYQIPGSWLASATGTVYTSSTATGHITEIDIFYRKIASATTEAFVSYADCQTVDSNAPAPLSGATTTHFDVSTISATTFDLLTNDSLIKDIPTLTPLYVNVTSGGVYSFINSAGKKGLIKVTALDATASGSITFNVKVQQ
jgi:hypothetical protein